jgi:hypothetical protein
MKQCSSVAVKLLFRVATDIGPGKMSKLFYLVAGIARFAIFGLHSLNYVPVTMLELNTGKGLRARVRMIDCRN